MFARFDIYPQFTVLAYASLFGSINENLISSNHILKRSFSLYYDRGHSSVPVKQFEAPAATDGLEPRLSHIHCQRDGEQGALSTHPGHSEGPLPGRVVGDDCDETVRHSIDVGPRREFPDVGRVFFPTMFRRPAAVHRRSRRLRGRKEDGAPV